MKRCQFPEADMQHAELDNAKCPDCDFQEADLRHARITNGEYQGVCFRKTKWDNGIVENAAIDNADFAGATGLTGRFGASLKGIRGSEKAKYAYASDVMSWKIVRNFGAIPLFGASYAAIITIWLWAVGVSWYNEQLTSLQSNENLSAPAQWITHLAALPRSAELGYTLIAILLIAAGSTIYRFLCPKIIQEHTETHWKYVLRREVMAYRAESVRSPVARWVSGICYVVGGGCVFWQIGLRVFYAARFLLAASSGTGVE